MLVPADVMRRIPTTIRMVPTARPMSFFVEKEIFFSGTLSMGEVLTVASAFATAGSSCVCTVSRDAPHETQNLESVSIGAPHFGQFISSSSAPIGAKRYCRIKRVFVDPTKICCRSLIITVINQ